MRKLFAMVATVAMVLSMFAGIAFAADTTYTNTNFSIVLTSDQTSVVTTGSTPGFYILTGQVYAGTAKLDNTTAITNGITVTTTGDTTGFVAAANINPNGTFTYAIPTNGSPADYAFAVNKAADAKLSDATNTAPAVHFNRKATVEFSKTEFDYSTTTLDVLTLTVRDAAGSLVKTAVLNAPALTTTNVKLGDATLSNLVVADGYIAFVVTSWNTPGEKALTINGVELGTVQVGEVSDLGLTVTPRSSIKKDQLTPFDLMVTGSDDLTGVTLTITGPATAPAADLTGLFGGTYTPVAGTVPHFASRTIALDSDGEWELEANHTFTVAGTYTITASKVGYGDAVVRMVVATAADGVYEYVRTDELTTIPVGTTNVTIGSGDDYEVIPVGYTPGTVTYEVYVDGEKQDISGGSFNIAASKIGEKEVRIMTFVDGVKKLDKLYTVKVTGWDISYDVNTFIVNKSQTVTFTVKDTDGNAINNALIYVVDSGATFSALAPTGTLLVNPSQTNISNGTYSKSVKYTVAGQKDIYVVKPATSTATAKLMAKFAKGFNVTGEMVYNVASNVETLLAGLQEKVTLTVTSNGTAVLPAKVEMQVGSTITPLGFNVVGNSIKVNVLNDKAKDATIRVMNAAGDKAGEVVLKTVAPKLVVLNGNNAITENINTALNFKVVDPRDDSVLAEEITLSPVNVTTMTVKTADKKGTLTTTLSPADAQDIVVLVEDIDWENLEEFSDVAKVNVKVLLDALVTVDGSFEVKQAQLVSDPSSVVLGQPANLKITYTDANGKAIVDKKVYLGSNATGTEIGTTDANGQVFYAAGTGSSAALKFAAKTDVTTEFTTGSVTAGIDIAAPVVTAPATSTTKTATITVTDNVRVVRVMINGVEDTTFFPGATYTKTVNLVVGANTFTVQAMDANYNTVSQTVTINYAPATGNSTVLQGAEVARQGNYTFVQLRQFEELGATVTWNATAKTATFVAGGKTVVVTIGSTTATVNGVAATMPAAAYLSNGRTYIPVRFVAEALNWNVAYAAGDVITITLD